MRKPALYYHTPLAEIQVQKLPMGVYNRPDIFQENISKLFKGFEMVCLYIDDSLVITKKDFQDHLNTLEKLLQRLAEPRLKVNTKD